MIQALLEIFDLHFKRSRVQNPGANSQLIGNPPYFWNPWIHSICTIRPQSISFFKGQIRRSVNLFTALLKSTLIFLSQNQQLWAAWEGGGSKGYVSFQVAQGTYFYQLLHPLLSTPSFSGSHLSAFHCKELHWQCSKNLLHSFSLFLSP